MRSDTKTGTVRRSNPSSDRYGLFNPERRISGIVDRRVDRERRRGQRRTEYLVPLSAYLS
jgi:hypothetical protein